MNDRHISSAFDNDLESIQARIVKMGGLVESAIWDSITSLIERDAELAEQVRGGDKAIDALERDIREDSIQLIALRAPTAIDLRVVVAVLRVASNLERIGDYAKNIAKRTTVLASLSPTNDSFSGTRRMARDVQGMLKDALDAFIQRDTTLAAEIIRRDNGIDEMYNSLFREYLTFMMEDPRNISSFMHLHFIAKNLERMGDHVTTICEEVLYLVDGEYPDDERIKADVTSTDFDLSDIS
jgi:phosphate transport system protein